MEVEGDVLAEARDEGQGLLDALVRRDVDLSQLYRSNEKYGAIRTLVIVSIGDGSSTY